MHAYEAIEQSLTYIEEHLTKEISTEKLANTVGLSPFYFQRLFKRLVNKPVQEYVKLRRLAKVIENLKSTEQRILDAALDYGFSSHANFTRAFKETYGITPENYKKDLPICSLRYMIYKKTARIMKSNFRCFGTMIEEGGKP